VFWRQVYPPPARKAWQRFGMMQSYPAKPVDACAVRERRNSPQTGSGLARRGFFFGGVALAAAPAIVRIHSLMPLSVPKLMLPPGRFTEAEIQAAAKRFAEMMFGSPAGLGREDLPAIDRTALSWWKGTA